MEMLINIGKVDIESKNNSDRMPLSRAAEKGYEVIARMPVDTGKVDIELKNSSSRTPLSLAAENGHESVVKPLQSSIADQLPRPSDEDIAYLNWKYSHR